jgi:ATP-dependent helicase HrpB
MNQTPEILPVETIRERFLEELKLQPVVLSAPTGSGKSTQVPRWCRELGRVLVIEPRRVACRGLAQRVAQLESVKLGAAVGYAVRDDSRFTPNTEVVFATPGVVLRWFSSGSIQEFSTVILDEFHERSLDVDLLLALLLHHYSGHLVVMSATLAGPRIAAHIKGIHLESKGRLYPVTIRHLAGNTFLPEVRGLEERIVTAIKHATDDPGDILVFLPGKAEISKTRDALRRFHDLSILPIHGGLTLEEQSAVFHTGSKRRVILATNVAETSITVPGIGVVIDSGLVRRTRYFNGRGFLTLSPIARDSAEQRTGRAGRTAPGTCYRLWSREAILTERTPPEIHRESLTALVMGAAACNARPSQLPFLDLPKPFAIEAAESTLKQLGALEQDGRITPRGTSLFHLPLDPPLAALLIASKQSKCLDTMIDLVSALAVGRQLFIPSFRPQEPADDLRSGGCDAIAAIRAVREGRPGQHGLHKLTVQEARLVRRRLRKLFHLPDKPAQNTPIDRRTLAMAVLSALPDCAHVARRRKKRLAWSNGGTEIELGRESAINPDKTSTILVLESRALGLDARKTAVIITCAMPIPIPWLLKAGIGTEAVTGVTFKKKIVLARMERIYAGLSLHTREDLPTGQLARDSVAELFLSGRWMPAIRVQCEERLEAARVVKRLNGVGLVDQNYTPELEQFWPDGVPGLTAWTHSRLSAIGLESGADLPLVTALDLLPPDLPSLLREWLDRRYPRHLDMGDSRYRIEYDLGKRQVSLTLQAGQRKSPPAPGMLPAWSGFSILARHGSKAWWVRKT